MKRLAIAIGVIAAAIIAGGQTIQPGGGSGSVTASGVITACGASASQLLFSSAGLCAGTPGVTYQSNTLSVFNVGATTGAIFDPNNTFGFTGARLGVRNLANGAPAQLDVAGIEFGSASTRTGFIADNGSGTIAGIPAFESTGSSPSNVGSCAVTAQLGGATAGQFVASGACAAGTYIFALTPNANNGWACDAEDRTTLTDTVQQIASSVTGATFRATTASADVVSWKCTGY